MVDVLQHCPLSVRESVDELVGRVYEIFVANDDEDLAVDAGQRFVRETNSLGLFQHCR